jgi:hypothetical protein
MKYLFFLTIAVVGITSCKKDYTCTCKDVNGTPINVSYRGSKKQAQKKCDYYNEVYQGSGITCALQ